MLTTAQLARWRARVAIDPNTGCWLWTGAKSRDGYGRIMLPDAGVRRSRPAHRVGYETFVGPIPDGLQIDHLCRVRHCVNPAHLEPVTPRENTLRGDGPAARRARQDVCQAGHPLPLSTRADRRRVCVVCQAEYKHGYNRTRRAYDRDAEAARKRARRASGLVN